MIGPPMGPPKYIEHVHMQILVDHVQILVDHVQTLKNSKIRDQRLSAVEEYDTQ